MTNAHTRVSRRRKLCTRSLPARNQASRSIVILREKGPPHPPGGAQERNETDTQEAGGGDRNLLQVSGPVQDGLEIRNGPAVRCPTSNPGEPCRHHLEREKGSAHH